MLKKDPIFWWATGISVLAIGLFALTKNPSWLALMMGSYLLRPTLASLGVGRKQVDERQMSIHYRSGNIGFAVAMIVCVIASVKLASESNHAFELFNLAIIMGLAAKALSNVLLVGDFQKAGTSILIGVGLLTGLFAASDAGSILEILVSLLPGFAIAGVGLLARRFPKPAGVFALIVAALMVLLIMTVGLRNSKALWGQIAVALLIGVPLVAAGACLLIGNKSAVAIEEKGAR